MNAAVANDEKGRGLKPIPQFQHSHLHNTQLMRDVRSKPTSLIDCGHCYFVGFRIKTVSGDLYHHAMIAADNDDVLFDGLAAEFTMIALQLQVATYSHISVIFIRNLMMQDPELVDCAEREGINKEIQDGIARHDERSFVVYGLIGERVGSRKLCLMEVTTQNALTAINTMNILTRKQHDEPFSPLEVSQSHPVIAEFDVLFQRAVAQMNLFSASTSAGANYLH
jgi:hypothetical protein